ncbi:MAG: L,D-transpeptidase [Nitrospiraceae bacterium]|nr:L,D-transpeptidase [Nitrospiraceae bacterium]
MNCRLARCLALFLALSLAAAARAGVTDAGVTDLCRVIHPSDCGIRWTCLGITRGRTLQGLFGSRWRDVARFNRVDRRHIYPPVRIKVPVDLDDIRNFSPMPGTYAPAETYPKFILIDLPEQFLGAYEWGVLVFSAPVTTGEQSNETPSGRFRITAYDRRHFSSIYNIEGTDVPYPMDYALRFHISRGGISYWIHGRDVPGYPISHGCVGLYDEEMQKEFYGYPRVPVLEDARTLFYWVVPPAKGGGAVHDRLGVRNLKNGPPVLIVGKAPGILSQNR